MNERMPAYGGQAVIEGVLMRGKYAIAMANRAPTQEIVIVQELLTGLYSGKLSKIPFLRGLIGLWDALGLGMRYLTLSANIQTGEAEKIEGPALYLALALSLMFGIGVFFLVPALISGLLIKYMALSSWLANLLEGILRLALLIIYLLLIGKMPDIQRVFMYHGAEHKTINAYEGGAELTVENVAEYPLQHPRCGTSFILTLVLLSILLFSLFGPLPLHWRLLSRLLMVPILSGIAYEYIRLLSRHLDKPFVRWIIKPNLALQNMTTREPTPEMLEVAIQAFNSMSELEKEQSSEKDSHL
ncbi:MAG: DUF1385 domain-containing protein [Chloroflexi bacterium]|nr:DUF1385 domain-containing protein [Chloroflexota bacterium]